MSKVIYIHKTLEDKVFYIGIGTEKRSREKTGRSIFWNRMIKKYGYIVEILSDNLTWENAQEAEIQLIKLYGRRDLGLGTLVNMTDGGDGLQGYSFSKEAREKMSINRKGDKSPLFNKKRSKEIREKISLGLKGRRLSKEHIENFKKGNKDYKHSEETKLKMSNSAKGKIISVKTRELLRIANRISSKKSIILLDPQTGVFYDSISDAARIFGIGNEALRCYLNKPHLNHKTNLIKV